MFNLLESREEDELHKTRLLNVEEKPFKRLTKRLLGPCSLLTTPSKLPTPPPDNGAADEASEADASAKRLAEEQQLFRDEVIMDFEAFDSSIIRTQFVFDSNIKERERYVGDQQRILETMQKVRDRTAELRINLDKAKEIQAQRKKFDELADRITTNKNLRPREDQHVALKKLEEECKDLERESLTYSDTWKERREQFGRIVEEGMQLRRLIRDEKEEVERREGMDGGDEDGEVGEGSRGGQTPKHSSQSGNATPRPDGDSQLQTPGSGLKPRPLTSGTLSRPGSRTTSRAASPAGSERMRGEAHAEEPMVVDDEPKVEESEPVADTPMAEPIELPATPQVVVDEPSPAIAEEGEATEDKMDTT